MDFRAFFERTFFHWIAMTAIAGLSLLQLLTGWEVALPGIVLVFLVVLWISADYVMYPVTAIAATIGLVVLLLFTPGAGLLPGLFHYSVPIITIWAMLVLTSRYRVLKQTDLAERMNLEKTFERSQMLFNSMAANFPDGFLAIINHDRDVIFSQGARIDVFFPPHGTGTLPNAVATLRTLLTVDNHHSVDAAFGGKVVSFEASVMKRVFMITLIPVRGNSENVIEVLAVLLDISRYKTMEADLISALEKERQLNVMKSGFVSSVSHEFRTPLSTILSSVFLLENYFGSDKGYQDKVHYGRIRRSVNTLTELLDDFLSMDKLDQGKVKVVYSCFSFRDFLAELHDQMFAILKSEQKLDFYFDGEDDEVLVDKNLVHNILLNLISNSIKYSPPGATVKVRAGSADGRLYLDVSDEGMGIAESEQKKIFKRFFRGKAALNIQGTGLGLHLVRKYVRLMQGDISFDSAPGKGSVFHVSIPQAKVNHLHSSPNHALYG